MVGGGYGLKLLKEHDFCTALITTNYSSAKNIRDVANFYCQRQASQVVMVWPRLPSRYAAKIILQGTADGSRCRGRPRKSWRDNINEWTGQSLSTLLRIADAEVERGPLQSVEVSPNDAWTLRELAKNNNNNNIPGCLNGQPFRRLD